MLDVRFAFRAFWTAVVLTMNWNLIQEVMKKVVLRILGVLALLMVGLVIFVLTTWEKVNEAPYPEIQASTDSAVIERGKYLAFGPAHCATCHVPMDKIMAVENGLEMPLSGGWELNIPPGSFRAPNITPDMETGIGKRTDAEIARVLRYSVGHDGRTIFPFMPFQELSDEDLTAVISFLRSQEAVSNQVEPTELSFLGKAIMAFGMIKPEGPRNTPPKSVTREPTVEYGKYIANSVGNCRGCHTDRDLKTGAYIGIDFAGGMYMPPDDFSKGFAFTSPNLTPDKETGVMTFWDEAAFIAKFKAGRVHAGSPMPWGAMSRMDSVELIAVYKFLQALEPVKNEVGKTVYQPGEKGPE